jgi:hypothetical protein
MEADEAVEKSWRSGRIAKSEANGRGREELHV